MEYNEWDTNKDGKLSEIEKADRDYLLYELCKDTEENQSTRPSRSIDDDKKITLILVGLLILGGASISVFPGVGIIFFGIAFFVWMGK